MSINSTVRVYFQAKMKLYCEPDAMSVHYKLLYLHYKLLPSVCGIGSCTSYATIGNHISFQKDNFSWSPQWFSTYPYSGLHVSQSLSIYPNLTPLLSYYTLLIQKILARSMETTNFSSFLSFNRI